MLIEKGRKLKFVSPPNKSESSKVDVQGERDLWFAVLRRAIHDAIVSGINNSPLVFVHRERTRTRREAIRWINDQNIGAGSFLWVCDHLDINFSREIRRLVNRGTREDYKQVKRLFLNKANI